ncbi:MAG: DUF5685 family protein [Anaerovoracaceae bacterium]
MLGYVTVEKSELKIREYEIYSAYYCGVCKSIGKRLGQLPRFTLSYDAAFLALLLSGLENQGETLERQHCIVHPVMKKTIVLDNKAVDYAADVMVILAYHKFLDDINDDNSLIGHGGKLAFGRQYRKLVKEYPALCEEIGVALEKLMELEKEKCNNLDKIGENFAIIMERIFANGPFPKGEEVPLAVIGKHLGKWIYLIDATDDLETDIKSGAYNPLIYRFEYDGKKESAGEFWDRIKEQVEFSLFQYLAQMSNAYDLLGVKKNQGIIENIVFMGLRRRTETILEKGITKE